ncbi:2OG-Fe(II) oxygenase [Rhodocytophaga rosea]|uniref:2OG-Fe(II) oxygenase n=1 Tax=Rhodocytophaga rosea TaxID=2704465 RepID=A0A6C0GUV7_9BACT|nr:2OG-Fe(II) oxygenase [Rhodocytophaga rosea]
MLKDKETIFDFQTWNASLAENNPRYRQAQPYPHIVLNNFLEEWAAEKALSEFPAVKDAGWIHYVQVNEKKHGLNKMDMLPLFIKQLIQELNSSPFLEFISKLTGIKNLVPDDMLEGGGLHQSKRGGFLNVHADFTVHPHKRNWRRRVNLLIYLNKDWKPDYKGDLELWDRQMKGHQQKISTVFNRCVIFNTDEDSYHRLPDAIECPEDIMRKSIALYYFTEEKITPKLRPTNYQARPQDGAKSALIYLDKKLIAGYTFIKSTFGINDDFVSRMLILLNRKKYT